MNKKVVLAIPIAGRSKRFIDYGISTHKAFLKIQNTFLLKKIISKFPRDIFSPCVICTHEQFTEYEVYFDELFEVYPELIVQKISQHDLGPTYSLRQLEIDSEAPLVIHYCDFIVEMGYEKLIDYLNQGIFCAPFFKGFHPASFGETTFCYMKINPNNFLISLKEKSSFTSQKFNEPCSTGIYAFPTFQKFVEIADELLRNPDSWGQKESYTSLCMNIAIKKNYKVFCEEVNKFICLGTPKDYEEYLYWEKIYREYNHKQLKNFTHENHIITAAGRGNRFINEGYIIPKIFLQFEGKNLIEHAYYSIDSKKNTIISLEIYKDKLKKIFQKDLDNFYFFAKTPNGQLNTLNNYFENKKQINNFFVSSADYNFNFSDLHFKSFLKKNNPDVVIFTFPWKDYVFEDISNYGFVKSDEFGKVMNIIEKPKRELEENLLNSLLIGTFWFKSSEIIKLILDKKNKKREAFIASSLNNYLDQLKVYKFEVSYWLSLGTPKELQLAEYWFNYLSS